MRIRNKLITVQLILTMTLILSIIIISSHMSTLINVKNSHIEITHLNTDIKIFNKFNEILLTKRAKPTALRQELNTNKNRLRTRIDLLNNNDLLKKTTVLRNSNNKTLPYTQNDFTIFYNNKIYLQSSRYIIEKMLEVSKLDQKGLIEQFGYKNAIDEIEHLTVTDIEQLKELYSNYLTDFQEFKSRWDLLVAAHFNTLDRLSKQSLIKTLILLLLTISTSLILNYRITNKITKNLNSVNSSLEVMTKGDFSTGLDIVAGDEFGDLSRNFNSFIDELWKKLDSMNVIMNDIGHAMNEDLDLSKIYTSIIGNVTNHILSDAGGLFVLNGNNLNLVSSKGHLPPFFAIDEDLSDDRPTAARYLQNNPISIDTPIIHECFTKKAPVIVRRCDKDPSFPQCRDRDSALFIGSFMMVPLINAGEIIGIFVLIRTNHQTPFSDLDISNFTSFSDYAALTIDTLEKYNELLEKFEMQKEIGVAADIQKNLIPDKMPKIKGISSGAYTLAAKGVSGDYYDFFQMNRTTIGATVCDVAGKGVPASLVMVMIRTILRLVASPKRGAAETLTLLNKSISGKINVDRYATMGFFKIDLENMKLSYSNAAHHPIQIFRQDSRKFYEIDSPGLPVGIDRDSQFSEKRVSLSPGDIIFMYTDGFPEARNPDGDEYSTNRMLREIRLHCHKNAKEILDSVVTDMQKFTLRAKQHDDQTILIVKIDEEM